MRERKKGEKKLIKSEVVSLWSRENDDAAAELLP